MDSKYNRYSNWGDVGSAPAQIIEQGGAAARAMLTGNPDSRSPIGGAPSFNDMHPDREQDAQWRMQNAANAAGAGNVHPGSPFGSSGLDQPPTTGNAMNPFYMTPDQAQNWRPDTPVEQAARAREQAAAQARQEAERADNDNFNWFSEQGRNR